MSTISKKKTNTSCQIIEVYKKSPREMTFLQMGSIVAMRSSALAGNIIANPYIGLFQAPLVSYHELVRGSRRISLMMTAAQVGMVSEAAFYGMQTADTLGKGVNTLSRTVTAVGQLAGFSALPLMGLIFTLIIPRFVLATSILGLSGEIWVLFKIIRAKNALDQRKCDNLSSLIQTLSFIKNGSESDSKSQKIHRELHEESLFRIGSYQFFQAKINDLLNELHSTLKNCLNDDDPKKSLQDMLHVYENMEKIFNQRTIHEQFKECRETLKIIFQNGQAIIESTKSETRRLLLQHMVLVLISMLFLAANCVSLFNQEKNRDQMANILAITAASLHMCRYLFDACVSQKKYEQLESYLLRRPRSTSITCAERPFAMTSV